MTSPITWPQGRRFAFTIFDDPDGQTLKIGRLVYDFLSDLGFRTTRGVWPLGPLRETNSEGTSCADPVYVRHNQELQAIGFEIGYHNATAHSATREETVTALGRFHEYFGHYPNTMANHYNDEAIYWGSSRVSGLRRLVYDVATLGRNARSHFGHVEGHPAFWGDFCREKIRYCRNFVYPDINTLRVCPWMPYHDPSRPYVREWYAAAEGATRPSFIQTLSESNQERLEAEGGACIMYTHFGLGFVEHGRLDRRFQELMTRLSRRGGWFVPAATLLDYVRKQRGDVVLGACPVTPAGMAVAQKQATSRHVMSCASGDFMS